MCDKNHSFFIKSISKYTLIYSHSVLVKLISCFTTDGVELSLSPTWSRASATLINMQFLYVRRVQVFGKRRSIHQLVEPVLCMD
jgi:hypothetical protein